MSDHDYGSGMNAGIPGPWAPRRKGPVMKKKPEQGLDEESIAVLIASLKSIQGMCVDEEPHTQIRARVQRVIDNLYNFIHEGRRREKTKT